jgi:hypothetical protein
MRRRSTLAALVSCLVAASALLPLPAGAVAGFGDLPIDAFYTEAVQWMVDNSITTGTSATCFSPEDPVTRGQAAAFMWRMEGAPVGSPPHPFVDVTASWQQEPVAWMAASGITTGTSATTFSPEKVVTRGEVAAFLHRLAGSPDAPPPTQFTDVVEPWQVTPIGWMVQQAITTGTSSTTFSPSSPVTRGQIATFLHRYEGEPVVTIDRTHPSDPACDGQVPPPPLTPDEQRASFLAGKAAAGWLTHVDGLLGWSLMYPPDWEVLTVDPGQVALAAPGGAGLFAVSVALDALDDAGSEDYLRKNVQYAVSTGILLAPDYAADLSWLDADFDGTRGLQDLYRYDLDFAADPFTGEPIPAGYVAPTWWYGYYDPNVSPDYGYIMQTLGVGPVVFATADDIAMTFTPPAGYP